jgi:Sulfotransferase domain
MTRRAHLLLMLLLLLPTIASKQASKHTMETTNKTSDNKATRPSLVKWTTILVAIVACCIVGHNSMVHPNVKVAFRFTLDLIMSKHTQQPEKPQKPLVTIFGAGFPRTGTKSIEAALHLVSYKVYDTRSVMELKHIERWIECARGWRSDNLTACDSLWTDIENEGYTATLDFPVNMFAVPLSQVRPNAKVLLSYRDNLDEWFKSWRFINKTFSIFTLRPWRWFLPNFLALHEVTMIFHGFHWKIARRGIEISQPLPWYEVCHHSPGVDDPGAKQEWVDLYNLHVNEVKDNISKDRLLEFNVKEGWAPLVDFMGWDRGLLDQPFPRLNDRANLVRVRGILDIVGLLFPLWTGIALCIVFWVVRTMSRLIMQRMSKKSD